MSLKISVKSFLLVALCVSLSEFAGKSQITTGELTGELNVIESAVPFLTIAPDSRSGAMGDVGVATSPDIASQHWNLAKYPFIEGDGGLSFSYTPWLRNLINDINLAYLVGYKRLGDNQVISASLRYFSLGNIVFTDRFGGFIKDVNPNELAVDVGYSRLFSDNFSGGIAFRFIRSDLTGGSFSSETIEAKPGVSVAADLGFFYTNEVRLGDYDGQLSFGTNFSNMGRKISYSENQDASFIPINWRLGSSLLLEIDSYNSITFALDFNKLLVPTSPIYYNDSLDADLNPVIQYGKDPDVSVPVGMFRSFYDAPGVELEDGSRSVFREELNEINIAAGLEYWYREQFAIRTGYYYEHITKGNRKFFTVGVGLRLNIFEIDFSYLIPTQQNNPLANTIRFTLGFDFDDLRRN